MTPPKGWLTAKLGTLTAKIGSGATPKGGRESYEKVGTPLIRSMNVHFRGFRSDGLVYLDGQQADALKNVTVAAQDVLLNITGASIGRVCLAPDELAGARVNQHVCIIRPLRGISPRYVEAYLSTPQFQKFVHEENYGVTRQALTKEMIEDLQPPIPPVAEQHRIVAKLYTLNQHLTRARNELKRVPALATKIRASTLARAYRGELVGLHSVKYDACERWISSTFYGPRFGKEDYVDDGIPTVRTTDFRSDGSMLFDDAPRVVCGGNDFKKWSLQDGDLLVTRTGSIGKCAIYSAHQGPALPSAYLIRVRLNQDVLPIFAWMMFASPQGQSHLGANSRAVTQPNINASAIRFLAVPALTLEQQRTTVRVVERQFARADRLEAEAVRATALLDRLEASILAKAFRGELVPQDPADEPASALLNRIRAERAAAPKARRGRGAAWHAEAR